MNHQCRLRIGIVLQNIVTVHELAEDYYRHTILIFCETHGGERFQTGYHVQQLSKRQNGGMCRKIMQE